MRAVSQSTRSIVVQKRWINDEELMRSRRKQYLKDNTGLVRRNRGKKREKIALVSSDTELARSYYEKIVTEREWVDPEDADVIVVLGGDGFMLESLHQYMYALDSLLLPLGPQRHLCPHL
jgi:NAD kinase